MRLDRALATPDWSVCFPLAKCKHLSAAASDHVPILLSWRSEEPRPRGKKRFRYEVMWESHAEFSNSLLESWQKEDEATTLQELQSKLKKSF